MGGDTGNGLLCLRNETTGAMIARRARVARGLWGQFVGLMGRADVGPDEALGLPNCAAIHTFFVRVRVDTAFCDREGRVLRLIRDLAPFRITGHVTGAAMVWEMRAGGSLSTAVSVGDILIATAGRE